MTNPAAVGGAGVVLGLQILDKKAPADPNVHVTPELWDNTTAEGKAALAAANDDDPSADLAARPDRQGLDHLRQGRRQGLQGPGRVADPATVTQQHGGAGFAGTPVTYHAADPDTRL